ncbi:MAG: hypothetical protein M5R40_14785 [Anaerolineae bacterium]|nr:hypothetical protein [Anaerolineae bacterium]
MEPRIRERFNDGILRAAMQRYGIADGQITRLDGFEASCSRSRAAAGLHLAHRTQPAPGENLIQGEVDWINYLADGGASVARAALSARGRLVEAIDDGQGGASSRPPSRARGRSPWESGGAIRSTSGTGG